MTTVKIGLVAPCGSDVEERNPAASMYFRDMLSEMGRMDTLQGRPFELHWVCEKSNSGSVPGVPSSIIMEPTWTTRDFLFSIPRRLQRLRPAIIQIHHEPFMLSHTIIHSFAFLAMLVTVKLLNRKSHLILTLATVYEGRLPKEISRQSPLPRFVTDLGFKTLLRMLPHITDAIMVAKAEQRDILVRHYGARKDSVYVVLSYTIDRPVSMDRTEARRRLGLSEKSYVILNFGCLSYYKGLERLLPAFYEKLRLDRDAVLLLAGGAHPRLLSNRRYAKFISQLKQYAAEHDTPWMHSVFTGFVPNEKVPLYFAAADIVVAPYTCHISSSAVLFDAISYEKPTIMTRAILEHDLLNNDKIMLDSADPNLIAAKIGELLTDTDAREKNLDIVRRVKNDRLIHKTATQMVAMFETEMKKLGRNQETGLLDRSSDTL